MAQTVNTLAGSGVTQAQTLLQSDVGQIVVFVVGVGLTIYAITVLKKFIPKG